MTERQKKLIDEVENCHKDMQEEERARLKPYEDKIKDLENKQANAEYQLEGRENEIKKLQEDLEHKKIAIKTRNKRIKELEAQIEKMKCCSRCKHYSMSFLPYYCTKNNTAPHCTSKCDKWEIKEND